MPLFGRRRRPADEPDPAAGEPAFPAEPVSALAVDPIEAAERAELAGMVEEVAAADAAADEATADGVSGDGELVVTPGTRPTGAVPRDAADVGPDEEFLNLGGIRLGTADDVLEGIEIQLQADPETGTVLALLLVDGEDKALELRAFAAARHEPLWDEVRAEIAAEAVAAGGLTQPVEGRWGTELLVQLAVQLPDGQPGMQVTRFVGVDGPRWLVRAAFLGRAAVEPETAAKLDAVLAGVSVFRGAGPMAPREPLPFAIPGQPESVPLPDETERPPLEPFDRGPEITEIR